MEIEEIIKQIEKEQDFEKVVDLFAKASVIIKANLDKVKTQRGRLTEIVRDLDGYIEKEFKLGGAGANA